MIFLKPPDTKSQWIGRRYLFKIGALSVPSFTAMLYIGYLAGLVIASYSVVRKPEVESFALATLVMLVPALIGARLWFVLEHLGVFLESPSKIFRIRDGGVGLYGGLALTFVFSPLILQAEGLYFWRFWDGAAVVMLVGLIVTRFGCLMHGCCCGRETGGRLGMWLPNFAGQWRRRYPTQLIEAGCGVLILVVELWNRDRLPFSGALFLSATAAYAACRSVLELTRAEASSFEWQTRLNMAFSALLVVIAGGSFLVR